MSTRETILTAVATTLSALAGGRVYRSRREQLPDLPAIVVTPEEEDAKETVLGRMDRRLRIAISVYARGETPDSASDAVLAAAWAALALDPSLGQSSDVCLEQTHRVVWDIDDNDLVRATLTVTVGYRTSNGDM